jgi:hypothetical protein
MTDERMPILIRAASHRESPQIGTHASRIRTQGIAKILLLALLGCGSVADDRTEGATFGDWTPVSVVGEYDSADGVAFGGVRRAALNGDVAFVLDDLNAAVVAFFRDGRVVVHEAGHGAGPGELGVAVSIHALTGDTAVVVDRGRRTVNYFSIQPNGSAWVRSWNLPFPPISTCLAADGIAVLGMHDESTLHFFTHQGARMASGGAMRPRHDPRPAEFLPSEMGEGVIACDRNASRVVHVLERAGFGFVLDRHSGDEQAFFLPDFAVPEWRAAAGGVRVDVDPQIGYADRVAAAVFLDDETVHISARRQYPRDTGRPEELRSIRLDLRDLTLAHVANDTGYEVLAANAGLVVARRFEPIPQVIVLERSP